MKHQLLVLFVGLVFAACNGGGVGPSANVNLTASATSVAFGDSVTLTWSAPGGGPCIASGDWSGNKPPTGSEMVGPFILARTYGFSLICDGSDAFVAVVVAMPAVSTISIVSVDPPCGSTLTYGDIVTIWSDYNLVGSVAGQVWLVNFVSVDGTNHGGSYVWRGIDSASGHVQHKLRATPAGRFIVSQLATIRSFVIERVLVSDSKPCSFQFR